MKAGELRHVVRILEPAHAENAAGERVAGEPTILAQVSAGIRPASARELMQAQAIGSQTTHTVTVRYLPGVKTKHHIEFNGRRFEIDGVVNVDERDIELRILCHEVT